MCAWHDRIVISRTALGNWAPPCGSFGAACGAPKPFVITMVSIDTTQSWCPGVAPATSLCPLSQYHAGNHNPGPVLPAGSVSESLVLRPPAASFARMPRLTRSTISRCAVSCEHLARFAHFDEVSLPSNPSSNRLTTFLCFGYRLLPSCTTSAPVPGSSTPREQAVADGSARKLRIRPWSSWGS